MLLTVSHKSLAKWYLRNITVSRARMRISEDFLSMSILFPFSEPILLRKPEHESRVLMKPNIWKRRSVPSRESKYDDIENSYTFSKARRRRSELRMWEMRDVFMIIYFSKFTLVNAEVGNIMTFLASLSWWLISVLARLPFPWLLI